LAPFVIASPAWRFASLIGEGHRPVIARRALCAEAIPACAEGDCFVADAPRSDTGGVLSSHLFPKQSLGSPQSPPRELGIAPFTLPSSAEKHRLAMTVGVSALWSLLILRRLDPDADPKHTKANEESCSRYVEHAGQAEGLGDEAGHDRRHCPHYAAGQEEKGVTQTPLVARR